MSWKKEQVKSSVSLRLDYFTLSRAASPDHRTVLVTTATYDAPSNEQRAQPTTDCNCACE